MIQAGDRCDRGRCRGRIVKVKDLNRHQVILRCDRCKAVHGVEKLEDPKDLIVQGRPSITPEGWGE